MNFSINEDYSYEEFESQTTETNKVMPVRKRAAYVYHHLSNEIREEIVNRIINGGERMTTVSRDLRVNYSSVKSIINTYKKQGRIVKIPHRDRKILPQKRNPSLTDQQLENSIYESKSQWDQQYSTSELAVKEERSQCYEQYQSFEPCYNYEGNAIIDDQYSSYIQEEPVYNTYPISNTSEFLQRWEEDPLLTQMQNFVSRQLQEISEISSLVGNHLASIK